MVDYKMFTKKDEEMSNFSFKIAKKFAFPVRKSTPVVLTSLSYKQHLKKFVEMFSSLFLSPAHHQYEDQDGLDLI